METTEINSEVNITSSDVAATPTVDNLGRSYATGKRERCYC